jgi:ATP dependent DNA ligase-like protein
MPGFIKPQLATLKSKAPKGEQWLHEIKYDGYRIQVHANRGRKKVYTRNGLDWTKRFSTIAAALDIPGEAIIDGEVVVVHEGRTNFSELQAELAAGRQDRLVYYAFDLLWRDGDLRKLPQIERKRALLDLLGESDATSSAVLRAPDRRWPTDVRTCIEVELGRDHLEAGRRSLPFGAQRELAEDQGGAEGQISCRRVYQRPQRCRGVISRQAGRQRPRLHGQGWCRLVSHCLQPDQEATRYGGQPKIKANPAHQKAESNVGRAAVLRQH